MISSDLQNDYAAQQQAGEVDGAPPDSAGPPELTPEVKQQIADEVRNQLALENQEASLNEMCIRDSLCISSSKEAKSASPL